jgi:hypothetical protein
VWVARDFSPWESGHQPLRSVRIRPAGGLEQKGGRCAAPFQGLKALAKIVRPTGETPKDDGTSSRFCHPTFFSGFRFHKKCGDPGLALEGKGKSSAVPL